MIVDGSLQLCIDIVDNQNWILGDLSFIYTMILNKIPRALLRRSVKKSLFHNQHSLDTGWKNTCKFEDHAYRLLYFCTATCVRDFLLLCIHSIVNTINLLHDPFIFHNTI